MTRIQFMRIQHFFQNRLGLDRQAQFAKKRENNFTITTNYNYSAKIVVEVKKI